MTDPVNEPYLIWSNEHRAWRGPGRQGYVQSMAAAGQYDFAEAVSICSRAIRGTASLLGMLPEIPVRAVDAAVVAQLYWTMYPDHSPEPWE